MARDDQLPFLAVDCCFCVRNISVQSRKVCMSADEKYLRISVHKWTVRSAHIHRRQCVVTEWRWLQADGQTDRRTDAHRRRSVERGSTKYSLICSGAYRRLYDAVYRRSIDKPEEFWGEAAEDIVWFKRWDQVLDDSQSPFTKW